ncbi:MAG: hypothetical protein KDA66_19085 [Planctomycetaceae bacterium]|nr:hypothetical protein [Planctomycetaceae bacterium]
MLQYTDGNGDVNVWEAVYRYDYDGRVIYCAGFAGVYDSPKAVMEGVVNSLVGVDTVTGMVVPVPQW